jgi:hypothetical protein
MKRARAAALILSLSILSGFDAYCVTLYVRRVHVADRGGLTVGGLVQTSGDLTPELRETLDRTIGEISDSILLIPSAVYKGMFGRDSAEVILVGRRTLVIPRGAVEDGAIAFMDKLADHLEAQGLIGEAEAEIEIVQITGLPSGSVIENPVFRTFRVEKKSGLASGTAEFTFQGSIRDSGEAAGRIVLRIRQKIPGALTSDSYGAGVRANEPVSVVFRKGSIVIEMSGKALSSAKEGTRVSVFIPESRMSFTGIVTSNKAVCVEID